MERIKVSDDAETFSYICAFWVEDRDQCDRMGRLCAQCLAIYKNKKLPNNLKWQIRFKIISNTS